jgi:hypothetical protein
MTQALYAHMNNKKKIFLKGHYSTTLAYKKQVASFNRLFDDTQWKSFVIEIN